MILSMIMLGRFAKFYSAFDVWKNIDWTKCDDDHDFYEEMKKHTDFLPNFP